MSFTTDAFNWLKPTPLYTLRFYMKSGNVITARGVEEYSIKNSGNEITSVMLKQKPRRGVPKLNVTTIDLNQIEAVESWRE